MKKSSLIIKIAFGVSAAALLFSVVTLIRILIIGGNMMFPIIQVVGSAVIFVICALMLRSIRMQDDEGSDNDTEPEDAVGMTEETEQAPKEDADPSEEIDRLYQKYHMTDSDE